MVQIAEVGPGTENASDAKRGMRFRRYGVLIPFVVLLILWVRLFLGSGVLDGGPGGKAFDVDAAIFFSAARVMEHHGNPYDHTTLLHSELKYLRQQHLALPTLPSVIRAGNPPLFFWLLGPISELPYRQTALGWSIMLYLLAVAGFVSVLRHFGWKHRVLPCILFLAMPEVMIGPYAGNISGAVFASLAFSLLLAPRYPTLAGFLLVTAWLKPQIAFPLAGLIVLFHAPRPWRVILGFGTGTLASTVVTLLTTGTDSMQAWLHSLFGFAGDVAEQPNISSLAGGYVRLVPSNVQTILEGMILLAALAVSFAVWWGTRRSQRHTLASPYLLWIVWFLATPYNHYYDSITLVVPFIAIMGRDGQHLTHRRMVLALFLALFTILLYSWTPHGIQLIWIPFTMIGVLLWSVHKSVPGPTSYETARHVATGENPVKAGVCRSA